MRGLLRATVTDNRDPEGLMRLRVQLSGSFDVWALACLPAHIFTLPEIGAVVWVAHEAESVENLVWLGVLPGNSA